MEKNREKQLANTKKYLTIGIAVLLVMLAVLIPLCIWGMDWAKPEEDPTSPSVTEPENPEETDPEEDIFVNVDTHDPIASFSGLEIEQIASYTGVYMEDGSDEVVPDVMMLILKNTTSKDLQLARITVHYSDFVGEFEVTNLPAQGSVVLLEKNRHAMVDEKHKMIEMNNVVFFQEPMPLMENTFKIVGGDGYLDVTNISKEATSGTTFVYYKNSAVDIFYGGITYRVRIADTIQPGETVRVSASHYSRQNSQLVMVSNG